MGIWKKIGRVLGQAAQEAAPEAARVAVRAIEGEAPEQLADIERRIVELEARVTALERLFVRSALKQTDR